MDRAAGGNPDADNHYSIRRNENARRYERRDDSDDTYDQARTDQYLPSRQNYERNSQNGYSVFPRQQTNNDQHTGGRTVRQEDNREPITVSYRPPPRFATDDNQEANRRSQPPDQTQTAYRVDYPVSQNPSANPRSLVLDINISINVGRNRNPQVTATAHTVPPQSTPIRSTALIEDVGYIDIDIRSPERTARLVTDGSIRSSPAKQPTTLPYESDK